MMLALAWCADAALARKWHSLIGTHLQTDTPNFAVIGCVDVGEKRRLSRAFVLNKRRINVARHHSGGWHEPENRSAVRRHG
jgi:hypothetical protein